MRESALKYSVLSWVSWFAMLIILVVPFHAFLTVWGAHLIGHYTILRLWKEALLILAGIGLLFLMLTDQKIRKNTLSRRIIWLILLYATVNVIWGVIALQSNSVSAKAVGYGLIVNLRFLAFFLLCWALGLRMARLRSHWQWLLLWPAAIVVGFGLLQIFVLPRDFLVHFGYGVQTIMPFETINHDSHYIRITSTLRGANPLGAYLLIPLSMLLVLIIKGKQNRKQIALFISTVIVLFFSFSRSAWIGALLALATILLIQYPKVFAKRSFILAGAGIVALGAVLVIGLHDNSRFQNIIFHTQDNSAVKTTSNGGHLSALKAGSSDIYHQPLGEGPGSAGPASVYNKHDTPRIAENYYIQIGQETGLIGLTLFLLINFGVGYLLWLRRGDPLALGLFASLIGISFVCLLSHAWSDDTVAYIWWGLAGMAMIKAKLTDK